MKISYLISLIAGLILSSGAALASQGESPFFVDQSEGCFARKSYPCALKVLKGNFRIERAGQVYVLDQGAAIVLRSESEIQLLEGQLWIEKSSRLSLVINPFFKPMVSGEFWLKKENDRTFISNLQGEFKSVPVGFENWYGGLSTEQKVDSGIIQPIPFETFASNWSRIYSGPKTAKLARLKAYRDQWKDSMSQGTEFYAKVIERSMASVENQNRRERKVILTREQERKALNELFRSKNYLDPDSL